MIYRNKPEAYTSFVKKILLSTVLVLFCNTVFAQNSPFPLKGIVTLDEENAAIAKLKKLEADAKKKQAEQKKNVPAPAPKQ